MHPLCDVCHREVAQVGPFCQRCAEALLDAEAKRWLNLLHAGVEEKEEVMRLTSSEVL